MHHFSRRSTYAGPTMTIAGEDHGRRSAILESDLRYSKPALTPTLRMGIGQVSNLTAFPASNIFGSISSRRHASFGHGESPAVPSIASVSTDSDESDEMSLGDELAMNEFGELSDITRTASGGLFMMCQDNGTYVRRQKVSRHKAQKKLEALVEPQQVSLDGESIHSDLIETISTLPSAMGVAGDIDPAEVRREKISRAKALKLAAMLEQIDDRDTALVKLPDTTAITYYGVSDMPILDRPPPMTSTDHRIF